MALSLRWIGPIALAVGVVVVPAPPRTDACAVALHRDTVVEVASESAIIAWDPATKTQHFIRRAAFSASAKNPAKDATKDGAKDAKDAKVEDFGFLVPTPTRPVLEEADDKVFDELAAVTAPRVEKQKRPEGGGCGLACGSKSAMAPGGHSVDVLEEKHVAGYDAKVLKATDADALGAWLKEHNYESRPALTRWLKPYVEKGWIVTAFKIARAPDSSASAAIGTSAVRMSFTTDAPFFPYNEPDDMRDAKTQRLLRVFVLADKKMTGELTGAEWPGKVLWAGRLSAASATKVAPLLKVPGFKVDENTWLTEFEDHAAPRPGVADVVFRAHPDQTPVERPARITYTQRPDAAGRAGFAVLALGIVGVYLLQRMRFTRK
jgi:hypothetical protein